MSSEQVQPNGIDLTVEAVAEQQTPGRITTGGKTIGERTDVEPTALEDDAGEGFALPPGGYILQYAETISIPEGHVGYVYPRSSLMRNSCMLNTAVWDAGYTGKGEGLLEVHHDVELEHGARVAQLVFAEANHDDTYDGSYQGERVD